MVKGLDQTLIKLPIIFFLLVKRQIICFSIQCIQGIMKNQLEIKISNYFNEYLTFCNY